MKTQCLIVDDEPLAIQLLKSHVEQVSLLELSATCDNALDAFEVLKTKKIDLLFLDIQMPMLTGVEFLKSLPNPPKVIFTTAYRDYAMEGYELNIVDYLLKPITFERFFKSISKYMELTTGSTSPQVQMPAPVVSNQDAPHIYINVNKKHHKVLFGDILYIESLKDYLRLHLKEGSLVTKEKIGEFMEKLPDAFMRVHRSYIVNQQHITAFTATDIEIGPVEIPIGGNYKMEVTERLK
ncbi:MAG: response regulator transcription factor [Roseivirga sp.]|nr:response regulator transcription factor [Roseivirga sp.]